MDCGLAAPRVRVVIAEQHLFAMAERRQVSASLFLRVDGATLVRGRGCTTYTGHRGG